MVSPKDGPADPKTVLIDVSNYSNVAFGLITHYLPPPMTEGHLRNLHLIGRAVSAIGVVSVANTANYSVAFCVLLQTENVTVLVT